jgi:hypothetical protein
MQADEPLLIVATGNARYAVARSQVRALSRDASTACACNLSAALGDTVAVDERYALVVAGVDREIAFYVGQADLRGALPRLALPPWLAHQAHPAVVGLALDNANLIPVIDLTQLALQTGYTLS